VIRVLVIKYVLFYGILYHHERVRKNTLKDSHESDNDRD